MPGNYNDVFGISDPRVKARRLRIKQEQHECDCPGCEIKKEIRENHKKEFPEEVKTK